jgi:hypothetical protein
MSGASLAVKRFERWIEAQDEDRSLATFRKVFAAIWLLYDTVDLGWGMTERERIWLPHAREPYLIGLQVVLLASGTMMLAGRRLWVSAMIAATARAAEALTVFPLNDFFFVSIVDIYLAHSDGGPLRTGARPKWVRDSLLVQLGWVYLATAILKMSPDWLDGGHLFVRVHYLSHSHGWPYPRRLLTLLGSLAVDAALAKVAVALEVALSAVLFARRPYWLGAALALALHGFGALVTNVWFFSASMLAAVLILVPRARHRRIV